MRLTSEQQEAVDAFVDFASSRRRGRLSLGGHAGTGKSIVVDACVRACPEHVVVCAPTGKAAHVLRSKGVDDAVTMHSVIYRPSVTRDGKLKFYRTAEYGEIPLAIVDEASMLSAQLVEDIETAVQRVFYVGDPGQLEPPGGDDPGIMREPDLLLTQVHRQAQNSPVISFAHNVRAGRVPKETASAVADLERAGMADARSRYVVVQRGMTPDLADFDVVLCGFNKTRVRLNAQIRKARGFAGVLPQVGETVICLRNNAEHAVWNGMQGIVSAIDTANMRLSVDTDDGLRVDMPFDPDQFGAERTLVFRGRGRRKSEPTLWDFGYALTVHKSQGSEWPRVAVKEEIAPKWSAQRWRYTAATRASEELRWVL